MGSYAVTGLGQGAFPVGPVAEIAFRGGVVAFVAAPAAVVDFDVGLEFPDEGVHLGVVDVWGNVPEEAADLTVVGKELGELGFYVGAVFVHVGFVAGIGLLELVGA